MLWNFSRFSTLLTTSSRYDEYKFRWNDGKTLKRWNKGEIDKAGKKERQRKRNKWDETFHSCDSSRTQEQQLLFKKNSFYFCVCVCERKRERERVREREGSFLSPLNVLPVPSQGTLLKVRDLVLPGVRLHRS